MEQRQISLEEVYHKLILIERALKSKGIMINEEAIEDEGELTEEYKKKLENARITPLSLYISHEEVKKKILSKKR